MNRFYLNIAYWAISKTKWKSDFLKYDKKEMLAKINEFKEYTK